MRAKLGDLLDSTFLQSFLFCFIFHFICMYSYGGSSSYLDMEFRAMVLFSSFCVFKILIRR